MRTFNPTAERPARAVQAWRILAGKAMNRPTITYEDPSRLMYGKAVAGVLSQVLGHIAFYCKATQIPPLTALVIVKRVGRPGDRIPIDAAAIDGERENVYRYDWYNV